MKNTETKDSNPHSSGHAFTLVELLVTLGILALLALVATPALSRAKPGTRSTQCLSNVRTLMTAWQMYAQDNNDKAVVSLHGGSASGGTGDPTWGMGWVMGWLDWTTSRDNTNLLFLIDPRYARFAGYLSQPRVYKCPSDHYLSSIQVTIGWKQRVRSYSDNIYIGAGNVDAGPTDTLYKHITKLSQFVNPNPAEAWVFLEEQADSINDPGFFAPHQTMWIDPVSALHNGAAPFSFADGHAEMHKWSGSLSWGRATQVSFDYSNLAIAAPVGDPDIHWVSYHSVRNSSSSY